MNIWLDGINQEKINSLKVTKKVKKSKSKTIKKDNK